MRIRSGIDIRFRSEHTGLHSRVEIRHRTYAYLPLSATCPTSQLQHQCPQEPLQSVPFHPLPRLLLQIRSGVRHPQTLPRTDP